MNRRLILYGVLFASVGVTALAILFCINHKNNITKKELLGIANNIIEKNESEFENDEIINQNVLDENETLNDEQVIGKIIIPSLDMEAPVEEGTSENVLKEAVGHFSRTGYLNGNVCLASHNRGTYAHYFQNIDKLKEGDEVTYYTKLGKRKYVVEKILIISEYDLSVLENTDYNCLTLITCIKNKPESRLCVRAREK